MTARELQRFLDRYPSDARLRFLDLASPIHDSHDLPFSVGEIQDQISGLEENAPVFLGSSFGVVGLWGFLLTPPTLAGGLTSGSIHSN
jgi:hypothetical protein